MKLVTISALIAVGGCLGTGIVTAATCGPDANLGPIGSTATVTGNSCNHNANFNGGSFCSGVAFSNTGTDVWAVTVGTGQSFTVTVASPGGQAGQAFSPNVGLIKTCADNGVCVGDNSSDGATTTLPASGTITGQTAGTYFLVVTDSTGVGNGCGTYDMSFTGTLPVKLENFSVD